MTAPNRLYIIVIVLMMVGWDMSTHAEGDSASSSSTAALSGSSTAAIAPDGTPVVHKSFHKKKKTTATATASSVQPVASDPLAGARKTSSTALTPPKPVDSALTITAKAGQPAVPGLSPTVETGLPVARHSDLVALSSQHINNSLPNSAITTTAMNGYSSVNHITTAVASFPFVDFPKKSKNTYPWKTNIYTTMFYIGEGASSISNTDNKASSFDANWVDSNHGTDNPLYRNGYASASHASTVNPFYVALPFNDLVYPEKARQWLPAGWHRPNKDGKPVSACKDRWVEIKSEESGHICYAQWEDVGPLRYDHAEYVFGPERPDTYTRAGLDVSPAVYDYLGMKDMKKPMMRWRFVDDEDVPPGQWLKLDEQAVLYEALHHKSANPPLQRASQPMDDDEGANKRKVDAAKG